MTRQPPKRNNDKVNFYKVNFYNDTIISTYKGTFAKEPLQCDTDNIKLFDINTFIWNGTASHMSGVISEKNG